MTKPFVNFENLINTIGLFMHESCNALFFNIATKLCKISYFLRNIFYIQFIFRKTNGA